MADTTEEAVVIALAYLHSSVTDVVDFWNPKLLACWWWCCMFLLSWYKLVPVVGAVCCQAQVLAVMNTSWYDNSFLGHQPEHLCVAVRAGVAIMTDTLGHLPAVSMPRAVCRTQWGTSCAVRTRVPCEALALAVVQTCTMPKALHR